MFETLFIAFLIMATAAAIFKVCFDLVSVAFVLWLHAPRNDRGHKKS